MSENIQSRALSILMEAIERPQSQREAFVQVACGGDRVLLREVQSLLESHAQAGEFLGSPTIEAPPLTQAMPPCPILEGPGSKIGRYKLLQLIGEGGFGSVFMAEQEQPVRRKVALKIIKLGMDTKQVVARFEAERQALALMDHPNIAKVLDAGATDTGRPFFVMELVKGVPITEFCDDQKLSTRERLDLFVQICQAIQHAHQKGVIHRDIKPGNVLVTMHDDKPVPKVIDFGIAKATASQLTEKTLFTEFRQFVGTPTYMSPEQAQMSGLDVDTRSDVYGLGVLLYELLTGTTPFDPKELRSAAYEELRRIIREVEPPRPSTRLSSMGATLPSVAFHRRIDPALLARSMKGELDWIVMKALEKDRTRRYETANGLAMDVRRYLNDETVEACPPSTRYRLGKLARKYRGPLRVTAAGVLLLLVTTAFSAWQAVRATRAGINARNAEANARADSVRATAAESDANRERDSALLEKRRANEQSAVARAVNDFLNRDLLGQADPLKQAAGTGPGGFTGAPSADLKVRDALDNAAVRIPGSFPGQPRVEAAIRNTIADAYRGIGQYDKSRAQIDAALALTRDNDKADPEVLRSQLILALIYQVEQRLRDAEPLLKGVWETRRRMLGDADPDTLAAQDKLAILYADEYRFVEAEALCKPALAERRRTLGADHRDTLESMGHLAEIYKREGHYSDAEALYKEALDGSRKLFGVTHPQTLSRLDGLARVYSDEGHTADAEQSFKQAMEGRRRTLGNTHPDTLGSIGGLADLYQQTGRPLEAESLHKQALEECRKTLGETDAQTLTCMTSLALFYWEENRDSEAEMLQKQALDEFRRSLGDADKHTLFSMVILALAYNHLQRFAESEALLKQAIAGFRKLDGDTSPNTLQLMNILAVCYGSGRRYPEAEALSKQALEGYCAGVGEAHPQTLEQMTQLARLYALDGRYSDAESLDKKALETLRKTLGNAHPRTLAAMGRFAEVHVLESDYSTAAAMLSEALQGYRKTLGDLHPDTLKCMDRLANAYERQGRLADAEPLLKERLEGTLKTLGAAHYLTSYALNNLGLLYNVTGRFTEAEALLTRAVACSRKALGDRHPDTLRQINNLAIAYRGQRRFSEAETLFKEALNGRRKVIGSDAPDTGETLRCLAELYRDMGHPADAEALAAAALLEPAIADDTSELAASELPAAKSANLLKHRGVAQARLGRFRTADADFTQALTLDPTNLWPWYYHGCLLAYLGDEDGYRAHCKAMLARFGDSQDKFIVDRTAKTCLLLPGGGDQKQLLGMAERAWAQAGNDMDLQAWFALCKSLALYRGGDFSGSAEWAVRCRTTFVESATPPRTAMADLLLAIANERLHKHPEAIASIERAEVIIQKMPQRSKADLNEGNVGIENWLACQALLREARHEMGIASPTTQPLSTLIGMPGSAIPKAAADASSGKEASNSNSRRPGNQ